MVIAHNLKAMNSQRQLSIVSGTVSKKAEKLSSGYRINRAADDAAGLSISEKMRRQIRGLTKATENAEDGISMVQIADGALSEVQDMLQRMNELCVQASNGTNAASDRQNIQDEVSQLITEIDRVAETTKFNETYLLNGSLSNGGRGAYNLAINNRKFEAIKDKYFEDKERIRREEEERQKQREEERWTALNGAYAGQEVSAETVANTEGIKLVYIQDPVVTTQKPGAGVVNGAGPTAAGYSDLKNKLQNEIVPNAVEAIIKAYSPAFDFLKGSGIGIGLKLSNPANDPNLSPTTLAYVGVGHGSYSNNTVVSNMLTYQLCVNLDSINQGNLTEQKRNELEVTIVHEMMHAFMDEALTNGMIGVENGQNNKNEQFPKWFKEGMAQTAAGGYYDHNDWVNGNGALNIQVNDSLANIQAALTKYQIGGASNESNYGSGYLACMYLGYLAGGKALSASGIQTGLGKILGDIRGGKSLQDVIKDLTGKNTIAAFENGFASDNNVLTFVQSLTNLVQGGTGGVVGNLTRPDDILANTNNPGVSLFKLDIKNDTVVNEYPNDYEVFVGGSATNGGKPGSTGSTGGNVPWDKPLQIAAGRKPVTGFGSAIHAGTDADMNNKIYVYIDAMDAASIGVDQVDVRTEDLASLSIERVSLALAMVSAQRSELGACQNRLEHTVSNLDNVVENTTASESQIRDTDMAREMVAFSNANILQQAGQAMLAQMNQSSQGVLSLIA